MNKRIKKLWLKAMRTPADEGGYVQTVGTTHSRETRVAFGGVVDCFCAMGVLANELNLDGGVEPPKHRYAVASRDAFAAGAYRSGEAAGMTEDQVGRIIRMNDDQGKTLAEIADWVEANL